MPSPPQPDPRRGPSLPITTPERAAKRKAARGAEADATRPDLHIEEIEDKHVPKDRNIFDK
jgi:hypothetical protein